MAASGEAHRLPHQLENGIHNRQLHCTAELKTNECSS